MTEWVDGHLDLAYLALAGGTGTPPASRNLLAACRDAHRECISIPDLRAGGVSLCFGTIFIEPGKPGEAAGYGGRDDLDGAERAGLRQIEVYEELEQRGAISIVRSRSDLDRKTDAIKVVILMEGADPIRSPEHVKTWFERGVRIVGLTWAMGSRYAGGNAKPGPLTGMGRDLVAALDAHGIIHDISHLSDPAVEELFSISKHRVIASHSNARALLTDESAQAVPGVSAGVERHLPDSFIREIARRDGVIGLNLFSKFLITQPVGQAPVGQASGLPSSSFRRATIADCIAHIEHIAKVMGHWGRRGIALGSDADGGFPPTMLPEGLDHPRKWAALADGLRARDWSNQDIDNFTHDNWLRFLREALPR